MIPKECKRLIEVDFPIAVVSKHAAREKSIRHGHPSTLHLWWARRPLASCRAVLLGLLLPDPCDRLCPPEFKDRARELLQQVRGQIGPKEEDLRRALLKFIGEFSAWELSADRTYLEVARGLVKAAHPEEPPLVVDPFAGGGSIPLEALRLGCEAFASDLNPVACLILKVMLEDIPRHGPQLAEELRRVGAEIKREAEKELADLYPKDPDLPAPVSRQAGLPAPRRGKYFVYVLKCSDDSFYIGQTEDISRRLKQHETGEVSWTAKHLPVEVIHWEEFNSRDEAVKREKELKTGFGRKWLKREYKAGKLAARQACLRATHRQAGGAMPIAYLWARTVHCEAPNCGAEIPLVRSFWLCKKANCKRALRYRVERRAGEPPRAEFEVFEPKSDREVPAGTVSRAKARCLACGSVLPPERVRAQLAAQRGGADVVFDRHGRRTGGARMLAVVTLQPGEQGRHYRLPTDRDYEAVWKAQQRLMAILDEWDLPAAPSHSAAQAGRDGRQVCPVPDERLPPIGTLGFRVQRYGMRQWGDLFTARQKVALVTLARLVRELDPHPASQRERKGVREAVRELVALQMTKGADGNNSGVGWMPDYENPAHLFARQAIPIVWDFCESTPSAESRGVFLSALDNVADVLHNCPSARSGQLQPADATEHPLPDETAHVWFTDPPYYDAVPYADLSDFFLVWLKRALPGHPLLRDPFDPGNPLTPKTREAVQNERSLTEDGRPKDREFYKQAMAKAFAEGRRVLREDGVGAVVFAHKTTEGWEALLSGLIEGGWTITGSWPIATEMASRLRARESAALATSVHLVCRPRSEDASVGDWADVLRELPQRVGDWMERLQGEGVRGADLVFACIGPALEIFSQYKKVETAEGREVELPEFLEKVWEVVGRSALEQILGTAEARARNSAAGALEEDARLTALFLWTLQSTDKAEAEVEDEPEEEDEDVEESAGEKIKKRGFTLIYDVVRRFAQPLGIYLDEWKGRVIEIEKGVVRLLPVAERARQLFGEDGAAGVADRLERSRGPGAAQLQLRLFPEAIDAGTEGPRGRRSKGKTAEVRDDALRTRREATTLDRVHAAMLLQASGRANALRALLAAEQERGPDFLRLANALSALYPKESEEKRLLDAMLLAVPRR